MVTHEHWITKGDSLLLKIMVDKNENKAQDKWWCDRLPPFSDKQMVFLCTLVGEQDYLKGKELAKMSTKEMDKL